MVTASWGILLYQMADSLAHELRAVSTLSHARVRSLQGC